MGKGKKILKRPPSPEENERKVYHVEVITQARVVPVTEGKKGKKKKSAQWEYLVKWAGYDSSSDSWEPEDNVAGCQRLLHSFWNHIGNDNADYPIGHTVSASEKWIKRERNFFAIEFNNEQEKLRLAREKLDRDRGIKSKKRRKITPTIDIMAPRSVASSSTLQETRYKPASDNSGDEAPLSKRVHKRKRAVSDSSDDDDIPLMAKTMKMGLTDRADGDNKDKQNASLKLKIPLPRRLDSATRSHSNTPINMQGQQVSDNQEKKSTEERDQPPHSTSPASLFSEFSLPERPLGAQPAPRSVPDKPAPKVSVSGLPRIPRRTNAHNTIAGLAPISIPSGSGISTKQRLAQGALNPTNPKDVTAASTGRPSLPHIKTTGSLLMNLSFKKRSQPSQPSALSAAGSPSLLGLTPSNLVDMQPPAPERQEITLAALNASSPRNSASMSPIVMSTGMPYVASPDHYTALPELFGTNTPPLARIHRPRIEDPYLAQAEEFLQNMMPAELAAPLAPSVEKPFEPTLPRPVVTQKPAIPLPRIQKKWSWSGPVYIDASGRSELLCNVTLVDATENRGMMGFKLATASMEHLDFPSFHNVVDLEAILRSCKPPIQYARLAPQDINSDGKAMVTLAQYMIKKQKVILTPVSMDNSVVAHIVFFPHIIRPVCQRFKVPSEVQVGGSLVAVLVPWSFTPAQRSRSWRKPPSAYLPAEVRMPPMIIDEGRWERSIRTKPKYQHAIRMLRFPLELNEYLSAQAHRQVFCAFWESSDVKKKRAALDTWMLYSVMEQCRTKHARVIASNANVVFVHVGALKKIHKLPLFVDRLSNPQVQFYTYGTHESVPPEEWGVREIYTCGGIVTFHPGAIMEDPIGVLHKIRQIQSHPLWMCYIHPSVLGMIAKLHCETEDPVAAFDRGKFPYISLLTAIEEGDLALLYAPPRDHTSSQSQDQQQEWIRKHWSCRPSDSRAMLEYSVAAFTAKYSNVQRSEWLPAIEKEISRDLSSMQRHPAIMTDYRRYVVLRNEPKISRTSSRVDGLEWTTPALFDFRDDFFPKQT